MEISASRSLPFIRLLGRLSNARFLTISALLHILFVLLVGGTVLFQRHQEPPDFEAGDGSLVTETVSPEPPQPPAPTMPAEQFQPPVAAVAPPVTPAITTMNTASTFQMQVPVAAPTLKSIDSTQLTAALSRTQQSASTSMGGPPSGGKGSAFGRQEKTPLSLAGTFYDLKQTRSRKPTNVTPDDYQTIFRKFTNGGWNEAILNYYYHAPHRMFATQIFIPDMPADEGPKAFGVEKDVQPSRWLVLYKARVAPPLTGTYHFVGAGDDVMVVRFNGKIVLDRCWGALGSDWKPDKNYDYGFTVIPDGLARGDALPLNAGEFHDIEILIGERPGGSMFAVLLCELEGIDYRKDGRGNPILPIFRVANQPLPDLAPGQTLPPYEADGPVWKVAPEGLSSSMSQPQGL